MSEPTDSVPVEAETKLKKSWWGRRPLWQKIVTIVVLFFVALVVIVNVAASGAVKVSNEFIKDIQNQRTDAAYSLLSKEAAQATPKDQFAAVVDRVGPLLKSDTKMTSKEVNGETGSSATSKVTYEIKGTDGITYKVTVNLLKEDGKWKVLNFDSTSK
ncbi:MAG: hypothetical protein WC498_02195 [Candidatus Saccharimonadales bacterium]